MKSWKSRVYESYIPKEQLVSKDDAIGRQKPAEFFATREHRVKRYITRHLPANREIRVVDLGCGHGAYLYFLKAAGYKNIVGVDVSQQQVDVAHKLGIPEAECLDILPYMAQTANESVDAILLIDVLEHLTRDELFFTLDEVFRILRPGGVCLAHVPNAEGVYGNRIRYGDITHENAFTPTSARQVFSTIGFSEVRCFEDEPEPHGLTSFIRCMIWKAGTIPHRLLLASETGDREFVLSQNMLVTARKL